MEYLYGEFSDDQMNSHAKLMHNEIHRLLLYKDKNVSEKVFDSDDDFIKYFANLLFRFGGLNELLGEPEYMVSLMSSLQSAYTESKKKNFNWYKYRRLILDSHGFVKAMFGEV